MLYRYPYISQLVIRVNTLAYIEMVSNSLLSQIVIESQIPYLLSPRGNIPFSI